MGANQPSSGSWPARPRVRSGRPRSNPNWHELKQSGNASAAGTGTTRWFSFALDEDLTRQAGLAPGTAKHVGLPDFSQNIGRGPSAAVGGTGGNIGAVEASCRLYAGLKLENNCPACRGRGRLTARPSGRLDVSINGPLPKGELVAPPYQDLRRHRPEPRV